MKSVAIEIYKVRCSGHMHRIGMCGGAIVLMDHPRGEREAMEVRKALAPDAPDTACHQLLTRWRTAHKHGDRKCTNAPDIMMGLLTDAREAHRTRRRRYGHREMPVPRRAIERWTATVHDEAQESLAANIRTHVYGITSVARWRVDVISVARGQESVTVEISHSGKTKRPTIIRIGLRLHLWSWWKLYQRGIAMVDGHFVVSVAHTSNDGIYVAAIRQEKDLSCAMHLACITRGEDGTWHLRWI